MNAEHSCAVALGDAMLDQDHAELFRLGQLLMTTHCDASAAALDALRTASREHFQREDVDLRALGGVNASCHLDEHAAVLKSLDEVHAILGDSATTAETSQRLVASLSLEFMRWLPEHISQMDANLASVRSKARFGGVPLMPPTRSSQSSRTLAERHG